MRKKLAALFAIDSTTAHSGRGSGRRRSSAGAHGSSRRPHAARGSSSTAPHPTGRANPDANDDGADARSVTSAFTFDFDYDAELFDEEEEDTGAHTDSNHTHPTTPQNHYHNNHNNHLPIHFHLHNNTSPAIPEQASDTHVSHDLGFAGAARTRTHSLASPAQSPAFSPALGPALSHIYSASSPSSSPHLHHYHSSSVSSETSSSGTSYTSPAKAKHISMPLYTITSTTDSDAPIHGHPSPKNFYSDHHQSATQQPFVHNRRSSVSSAHDLSMSDPHHFSGALSSSGSVPSYENKTGMARLVGRFIYSFKSAEVQTNLDMVDHSASVVNKATVGTASVPLARGLKPRHIQMIAYGGSIGTGLLISSGKSLSQGGPAALIIGFMLTALMLLFTLQALGELAVCFPVSGAFSTYSTRFLDPAWGFALGWNYVLQWVVAFPLELVAASITIQYWAPTSDSSGSSVRTVGGVPLEAWVAIFWFVIVVFNLFGVKIYGETEFIFSTLKLLALSGFIILGIVLAAGGSPNHQGYIGARYWHNPGSFSHGFKGVCSVFVNAAFSYSGSELAGLTAAETKNPRRSIPSAIKQVCWRIILVYILSLTLIGFLVPYNDSRLIDGTSDYDASASPFVIAIKNAGISGLPSVFNAAILIAVLSVGNASVYASTRTLTALAAQGMAPRQLGYIDNSGRPIIALTIVCLFGALAFAAGSSAEVPMFIWLMSISGLSCIFTWCSICLCHIRFRRGLAVQNRSTNELIFQAPLGVWGSVIGFSLNLLVLIAIVWVALFPVNSTNGGRADAENFFSIYLCLPVTLAFYLPYKIYYRTKFIRAKDMDLDTGRREVDVELLQLEIAEEKSRLRDRGRLYYLYKLWC